MIPCTEVCKYDVLEENENVHYVGKIDIDVYQCISSDYDG